MFHLEVGSEYIDPGYEAIDVDGNDLTNLVQVIGVVNVNILGVYDFEYKVVDDYGYEARGHRMVIVRGKL